MDKIIWSLVASNAILSFGHHVDHALRHKIGWPLNNHITPFTYALGIYVAIFVGAVLSRRGVVGPGFWSILAAFGLVFVVGTHFGPFADDPISTFIPAYGSQTKGALALAWLALFLASLFAAMLYAGWRWAMLRQRSPAVGAGLSAGR